MLIDPDYELLGDRMEMDFHLESDREVTECEEEKGQDDYVFAEPFAYSTIQRMHSMIGTAKFYFLVRTPNSQSRILLRCLMLEENGLILENTDTFFVRLPWIRIVFLPNESHFSDSRCGCAGCSDLL
jgi:hypothetical protein